MIGKVTRGSGVAGLLRYLYGPGKANEHTDAHLVASWLGGDTETLSTLEPAPAPARQRFAPLADRLNLSLRLLEDPPDKHVWQCSMRIAEFDRKLSDAEWATVAREVMERTGFAGTDDPGGCRWVAVRHADDHIHIVVVLARQDGQPVNTFRDWPKVHAAARSLEKQLGLVTVPSPDRSARVAPTRAEAERAKRIGHRETSRAYLQREVRFAAAASTSAEHFEELLRRRQDIVVTWRASQRLVGQVTGYRVGRVGEVDSVGQQIWFSGSKLSPDLSLPRLALRWADVERLPRPANRHLALARVAVALQGVDKPIPPSTRISVAETSIVLARMAEGSQGGPLTRLSQEIADAVRLPRGGRPRAGRPRGTLRLAAVQLAALGSVSPSEVDYVVQIGQDLEKLARYMGLIPSPGVQSRSARKPAKITSKPSAHRKTAAARSPR